MTAVKYAGPDAGLRYAGGNITAVAEKPPVKIVHATCYSITGWLNTPAQENLAGQKNDETT